MNHLQKQHKSRILREIFEQRLEGRKKELTFASIFIDIIACTTFYCARSQRNRMRDSTISSRVTKISLSVIAIHSLKYKVTRNFFFSINASTWLSLSIEDIDYCMHASMTHDDTSARIWTPDSHLHTKFRRNIFNSCTNDASSPPLYLICETFHQLLRVYLTFFHVHNCTYNCPREPWEHI